MKYTTCLAMIAACALVPSSWAAPIDLKGKTLEQTLNELLPRMGEQDAQQKWQNICFQLGAPGNEEMRLEACKLMAARIGPDTPKEARVWLLKQLERIGREECVQTVTAAMSDKDELVRDAAVRCLANNPSPGATTALLARMGKAEGKAKIGVLHALAHRGDPGAVADVAKLLNDSDATVAVAAARVLGQLATPEAAAALEKVRPTSKGETLLAVSDAYLRCADRRLREGKLEDADRIYKALIDPRQPAPIRLAALRGALVTVGDEAGSVILDILAGDDQGAMDVALGQIEHLSAAALKPLAASLDKLPVPSQVLVLNSIAARGDTSQKAIAIKAARSGNEAIKRAGIQALGRLGDAEVVPFLLEIMFVGGPAGGDAMESLASIPREGVDEKLISALDGERDPKLISPLIQVLERRKTKKAVSALVHAAGNDDASVRASAFAALRVLAEPKHVPEMVLALLKTRVGGERDRAEQAVVEVCGQIPEPEKRAGPVLAVLELPQARDRDKELLPLLGRLGGPGALARVNDALASSDENVYDAGVRALCNWPEPSVSDRLADLARSAKKPDQRLQSLRALVRVNVAQSERPNEQRLASLKKAMELADRDDERRLVLEGIGFVRHLDTLRFVVPYLDQQALSQSACKAVVELAHSRMLREPNQAEFNKPLDRVIAICKDQNLVYRARQYREGR
jgi:HEAT repeat protein